MNTNIVRLEKNGMFINLSLLDNVWVKEKYKRIFKEYEKTGKIIHTEIKSIYDGNEWVEKSVECEIDPIQLLLYIDSIIEWEDKQNKELERWNNMKPGDVITLGGPENLLNGE